MDSPRCSQNASNIHGRHLVKLAQLNSKKQFMVTVIVLTH
jgi:hypothetical protein